MSFKHKYQGWVKLSRLGQAIYEHQTQVLRLGQVVMLGSNQMKARNRSIEVESSCQAWVKSYTSLKHKYQGWVKLSCLGQALYEH